MRFLSLFCCLSGIGAYSNFQVFVSDDHCEIMHWAQENQAGDTVVAAGWISSHADWNLSWSWLSLLLHEPKKAFVPVFSQHRCGFFLQIWYSNKAAQLGVCDRAGSLQLAVVFSHFAWVLQHHHFTQVGFYNLLCMGRDPFVFSVAARIPFQPGSESCCVIYRLKNMCVCVCVCGPWCVCVCVCVNTCLCQQ